MSDPISTTVAIHGEDATLLLPATTAPYDPADSDDYAPGTPVKESVRGVPETKYKLVVGATDAFTMEASEKPAGLKVAGTRLLWRDIPWTIVEIRERSWLGAINGYTLFLAA